MRQILLFLLLGALILPGCSKPQKAEVPPPSVTVAPAVTGSIISESEIIGQAVAYDSVDLIARVDGFQMKTCFEYGQFVKKDQMLFEIEKDQYQAKVEAAQGALAKAQAQAKNAEINYKRQKTLFEQNAVAEKNFDDAEQVYGEAKANVLSTQADLDMANINLGYTDIKCPFDGKIGIANYSDGNFVGPISGKLANVVRIDPMYVQFYVSEVDVLSLSLERLKNNSKSMKDYIKVRLQFQSGTMYKEEGTLTFSDNTINTSTGTLMVRATFSNPDKILVPGMYMKVFLVDTRELQSLLIPQPAIQEGQAGKAVLVVGKDGKVSQRMIKTGIKSGARIQVTEGLKEGELVIVEGLQKVKLGQIVQTVVDESYTMNKKDSIPDGNAKPAEKKDVPEPKAPPGEKSDAK